MNPTPPGQPDPAAGSSPAYPPGGYHPGVQQPWGDRPGGAPQPGYPGAGPQQGPQPGGYGQQAGYGPGGHVPGGPQQGQPYGGYGPGPYAPAGPGGPGSAGQGFGAQGFGGHGAGGRSDAPARPRVTLPSLPVLAVLTVCVLALLNAIFGFLRSGVLERTGGGDPVPLGSVYAVAGWIPALLVVSGLAAAATRLKNVSGPTLWAVSAATAVTGGVGALFYLAAREGTDAGLGFALDSGANGALEAGASAGLVLIVLFGLLQLVAALAGLLLTQSPQLARRAPGGPDAAHRYGPGTGAQGQTPGGAPWGPPPAGADRGGYAGGPQDGDRSRPAQSQSQPQQQSQPYGQPGGPQGPASQGGPGPAHPETGGIAPYGQYARPTAGEAPTTGAPSRPQDSAPPTYDPQSGRQVHSGLTGAAGPGPAPTSPTPWIPEPAPAQPGEAERALRPDPQPPVEYRRTEYGSSDFEWEPTYSEAPDYEPRAGQGNGDDNDRDPVVRYETPEQRPPFAPPKLDSARHEGWDAGFAEDTLNGTGQPATDQDRYRPIPRAE